MPVGLCVAQPMGDRWIIRVNPDLLRRCRLRRVKPARGWPFERYRPDCIAGKFEDDAGL